MKTIVKWLGWLVGETVEAALKDQGSGMKDGGQLENPSSLIAHPSSAAIINVKIVGAVATDPLEVAVRRALIEEATKPSRN